MFKKIYLLLFQRISDALMALERDDAAQAKKILICAQQDAEELYIEAKGNISCRDSSL